SARAEAAKRRRRKPRSGDGGKRRQPRRRTACNFRHESTRRLARHFTRCRVPRTARLDELVSHGAHANVGGMEQRQLGTSGPRVSALGLGCMSLGIADTYTSSVRDDDAAVALIRRAIDLGITFLDTADIYGDSEEKVGKAIRGRRADVVIATKFGFVQRAIGTQE